MRRRSNWIWGGRIAAVVVLAGLAIYLASVGLNKANQLASVLSLLIAVAALVAPYLLPSSAGRAPGSGSAQQVTNTIVSGHLTQAQDVQGVRVSGSAAMPSPTAPASANPVPEGQGGQYVSGVWVGGNLTQVDDADGDITIG